MHVSGRVGSAALALVSGTIALALVSGHGGATQDSPRSIAARTWRACPACHAAPVPSIPADDRWIALNSTTLCLTGDAAAPERRRGLMEYLRSDSVPHPKLIRPQIASDRVPDGCGVVRAPATAGSAYLRNTSDVGQEGTLRLYWPACEDGSTLQVPCGTYAIVGCSMYRPDERGRAWTASATSEGEPQRLEVDASRPAAIVISPTIRQKLAAASKADTVELSFQLENERTDRVTLTCEGVLVAPSWELRAKDDTLLGNGKFTPT